MEEKMPKPDQTLDDFLRVVNDPHYGNYQNVNYLLTNVFCPNDPSHLIPSVGLTDYGPQFVGAPEVGVLFRRLFVTFKDFKLEQLVGPPRYYDDKAKITAIVIQARLSGTHTGPWFPKGNPHYSPPLSDIDPPKNKFTDLPACAVFSFDANGLIANIAIYFDRDRMARELS
jgi:hypothetical protein